MAIFNVQLLCFNRIVYMFFMVLCSEETVVMSVCVCVCVHVCVCLCMSVMCGSVGVSVCLSVMKIKETGGLNQHSVVMTVSCF